MHDAQEMHDALERNYDEQPLYRAARDAQYHRDAMANRARVIRERADRHTEQTRLAEVMGNWRGARDLDQAIHMRQASPNSIMGLVRDDL